jgi:hypothetical protein
VTTATIVTLMSGMVVILLSMQLSNARLSQSHKRQLVNSLLVLLWESSQPSLVIKTYIKGLSEKCQEKVIQLFRSLEAGKPWGIVELVGRKVETVAIASVLGYQKGKSRRTWKKVSKAGTLGGKNSQTRF